MSSLRISPEVEAEYEMLVNPTNLRKANVDVDVDVSQDVSLNSGEGDDILAQEDVDPVLNVKMHIVNNAIDAIGWTPYHWKLFVLNGFGYAVDSLIILLHSIIAGQATKEFNPAYPKALTISVNIGMLVGALFWGFGADVIGRRVAFNVSLFICSIAGIVAGAAPSWVSLCFFISLVGFGGGGNLVLDTAVFLEYLPSDKQWVLTWLAAWWGLGSTIAGLVAWPLMSVEHLNCVDIESCTYANNKGWRYLMYACSALVFVMSILRIAIIRLKETPKYLLGEGKDEELVAGFHAMAEKYNRPCTITTEQLAACGVIKSAHGRRKWSFAEFNIHIQGLFATKAIGQSTSLIWLSWTLIGLAYPLFYVFLSSYLATRGAEFGNLSNYETWKNYALVNVASIFGPMVAGHMANYKRLGRKYTMVIGALITMAFFFAYTQIKNQASNIGISCAISFFLNIYYGTLYAYTAEVLPSAHRATGNGIAVACNRVMGILSAVIATVADTSTSAPIFVCAALYIAMAGVAIMFPFEPFGRRSS